MRLDGRTCQRTLAFVNRVRKEQGKRLLKRLPKGKRHDPIWCPLANAVNGRAVPGEITYPTPSGRASLPTPEYVESFMAAFDDGHIPELIA